VSWKQDALCSGKHADIWFPPIFASERTGKEAIYHNVAKAVCYSCPVREECLEAGADEADGIWGGWTLQERKTGQHEPPTHVMPPQHVVYLPNHEPNERIAIKEVVKVMKYYWEPYES
jgi:WhiB family transcriptional regulator, redox-sensing transcriptional regulator